MLGRLQTQFDALPHKGVRSSAHLWDARKTQAELVPPVELVVSHPPYLNCFFIPTYRWEMVWLRLRPSDYAPMELVSWPAKSELAARYYRGNADVIRSSSDRLKPGGTYCIVIGDCTIQGVLEQTHLRFIDLCRAGELVLDSIIYEVIRHWKICI